MSTRIGTVQAPRAGHMFWLPALLTLLVVVTFAAVVVSIDRDRGREDAGVGTAENTLANTPTELRGGISVTSVSDTLANTPTELRGGLLEATVTDEVSPSTTGRRGVTPRVPPIDEPASSAPAYHSGQLR